MEMSETNRRPKALWVTCRAERAAARGETILAIRFVQARMVLKLHARRKILVARSWRWRAQFILGRAAEEVELGSGDISRD